MLTLADYLNSNNLTQAEFARSAGCRQATVSKLCTADASPSIELALKIEKASRGHVKIEAWPRFYALRGRGCVVVSSQDGSPCKAPEASEAVNG